MKFEIDDKTGMVAVEENGFIISSDDENTEDWEFFCSLVILYNIGFSPIRIISLTFGLNSGSALNFERKGWVLLSRNTL